MVLIGPRCSCPGAQGDHAAGGVLVDQMLWLVSSTVMAGTNDQDFARYAVLMLPPRPPLSRPVDFSAFWSQTIKELHRTLPMVEREAAGTRAGIRLEWLSFASLGKAPGPWSSTATATADGPRRGGGGHGPA
jgi:hypothetical protein